MMLTNNLLAQNSILNTTLTFSDKNTNTYSLLSQISGKTGYYFIYDSQLIKNKEFKKYNAKNKTIQQILTEIIPDSTIDYLPRQKHIILRKKNQIRYQLTKSDSVQFYTISGTIYDAETNNALCYANISLKNSSKGTISAHNGQFIFKFDSLQISDTLIVSHIGFENFEEPVKLLTSNNIAILLNPKIIAVQEIIIRNNNPEQLIMNALNKIDKNYSQTPVLLHAFYRETVLLNNQITYFSEAILNIYKTAYKQNQLAGADMVQLQKFRKWNNPETPDSIQLKLKGGINTCLLLDIIKNNPEFLQPENLNLYSYNLTDMIILNNKMVYEIEFKPKFFSDQAIHTGKIYIESESLALLGTEFNVAPQHIPYIEDQLIVKKNRKMKVSLQKVTYIIWYKQINKSYHINQVRGNLEFKIRKKGQINANIFQSNFEMAITNADTTDIKPFKIRSKIDTDMIVSDLKNNFKDDFWSGYNLISPDNLLTPILKNLDK